jgi:hypothetical protein
MENGFSQSKTNGEMVDARGLIREPRDRHPHPSGASKPSDENEEICLVTWKVLPDRFGYGDKEDTRYCVADECGDDLHQIVAGK